MYIVEDVRLDEGRIRGMRDEEFWKYRNYMKEKFEKTIKDVSDEELDRIHERVVTYLKNKEHWEEKYDNVLQKLINLESYPTALVKALELVHGRFDGNYKFIESYIGLVNDLDEYIKEYTRKRNMEQRFIEIYRAFLNKIKKEKERRRK